VKRSLAFADQVIQDFEAKSPLKDKIACRAGCAHCCRYEVILSPAEALLIGHRAKHSYSETDVVQLLQRINKVLDVREGKRLSERAAVLDETPCIFLEAEKCRVYEVRPLICRALHSLDSRSCQEAISARKTRVAFVGYTHRYYVFQAVRSAMRHTGADMGLQTDELTIARAMLNYFDHPEPSNAWAQGRKVFEGEDELSGNLSSPR
jgi:Fe-S-cluster containining protein